MLWWERSDFHDLVSQLRGGIRVAFGLTHLYSLNVGHHPAGPYASQEVVRHVRCQAFQEVQELEWFAVSDLFVRQELVQTLITG